MATPVPGKTLTAIKLVYCSSGGSSAGARDFINGKTHPHSLKAYVSSFQNVTVVPELRNGNHPFIVAEYENKVQHQWPLRNKKPAEILKIMNTVSNRTGRRYASFKIWTKPKTKTESVQGQWRPGMFSTPLGLLNGKHLAHEEFLNVKASESTVYARHADFNNVKNIANQLEDLGKIKNPVLINLGPEIVDRYNDKEAVKKVKKPSKKYTLVTETIPSSKIAPL